MSCFWNAWTKMNSVKFRQTGQGKTDLYTEKSSTYFSKEEKNDNRYEHSWSYYLNSFS